MRKHLKIATEQEDLATEKLAPAGHTTDDYGHDRAGMQGAKVTEHGKGPQHHDYGHDRASMSGAHVIEHGKGPDHSSYGHDRAGMHGTEVHEIDAEHVTLEEAMAALEDQCLAIEEAADVAGTLEQLAEAARRPMNQQSRRLLKIATESLLAQVGDAKPLEIALEAEDAKDDVEDAQIKRETGKDGKPVEKKSEPTAESKGLVEKVKSIWRAILAAMKKAWNWVKDFWRRLSDIAPGMARKAKKIKEELETTLKNHPHPGVREVKSNVGATVRASLLLNHKFPEDLVGAARETQGIIANQLNRFSKADLYDGKFLELIKTGKPEQFTYDPAKEIALSKLQVHGGAQAPHGGGYATHEAISVSLLGNQWIVQTVADRALKGAEALEMIRETPRLDKKEHDWDHKNPEKDRWGSYSYNKEVPLLELEKAIELCDVAAELAEMVVKFRAGEGTLSKCQLTLENLAEDLVRTGLDRQGDKDGVSEVVEVKRWHVARQHFCSQAPRIFAQEPSQVLSYLLRLSNHLSSYAKLMGQAYRMENMEKVSTVGSLFA